MEPALWLYVDTVLDARDVLLGAGINVIAYDLYPHRRGSILIPVDSHRRARTILNQYGIQVSGRHAFVNSGPSRRSRPRA